MIMTFKSLTDISLLIASLFIWLLVSSLYVMTSSVFLVEYVASGNHEASMWMLTLLLWIPLLYCVLEYSFYIVRHVALGCQGFPVLSLDVITLFDGKKKFISVLAIALALKALHLALTTPISAQAKFTPALITILIAPVLLVSTALSNNLLNALNPAAFFKTIAIFKFKYLLFVAYLGLILLSYTALMNSGENFSFFWLFINIYFTNHFLFFIGKCANQNHLELGIIPDHDDETASYKSVDQIMELEFSTLASQIYYLSSDNRVSQGVPKLIQFMNQHIQQGAEEGELWKAMWLRLSEWQDPLLMSAMAKHYVPLLMKQRKFALAWLILSPILLEKRRFPFKSIEDCLHLCEFISPSDGLAAAAALDLAAKQITNDNKLRYQVLFRLAQVYCHNLNDLEKAKKVAEEAKSIYPEAGKDFKFVEFIELLKY